MIQSKTILSALPNVLQTVDLEGVGKKTQGKVRDIYLKDDQRILITTDRQSAFDVVLGHIPFKGTVLNQLSKFWFEETRKIIQNHMIAVPDPNMMITHNCQSIPVEMVIRGYISGVTNTSIWGSYAKGERTIYGLKFPDGLQKNQKLPRPVITPTTHPDVSSKMHDERLTRDEIIANKIVPKKMYEQMEEVTYALFDFGSKLCKKHGLILVDTKYEFGLYEGKLILIDEIHTPDSSRFWIADSYEKRFKKGEEPENYDKEFLRLWYAKQGYKGDGKPPKMTDEFIVQVAQRYIGAFEKITGKKFAPYEYPIENRIKQSIEKYYGRNKKLRYEQVGDNYETKDPIKKLFQQAARDTGKNLQQHNFSEVSESRGESAFVWQQGKVFMASVIEGLGTKNLIADGMRQFGKKTYYDVIAHDTVATIINDLISVGARPLVLHAYWAIEDNDWLYDEARMKDLILGWKSACDIAGVTWGGGETATMKQIVVKGVAEFAGSAIGIIPTKKQLILDSKMKSGDRILLLKSNGVNANGISLTRAIAKKLPKGYATKLSDGTYYGEALLTKSNMYAKLIADLLDAGIDIHYLSNITGHGMRKVMRARPNFTYNIEKIFEPQEVFHFIQKHASLTDEDMYQTYNMGQDYAIFIPQKDMKKALRIVKKNKFEGLDAGNIEKGEKQVIIMSKNIVYKGSTLDLR